MGVVREKESGGWENCGREEENCGREEECERQRVGEEREKGSRGGRTIRGKESMKEGR